jgi:hypothetical protein
MTEAEWLAATDPRPLLQFLQTSGKASGRKLRLFACACCRRTWHRLADERSRRAVEVAERFADGAASTRELRFVFSCAADAYAFAAASGTADARAAAGAANAAHADAGYYAAYVRPREEMLPLLRDLFGNPFRPPPALDPPLVTWHGGTVVKLAESIYQERRWGDLPVLGDVLEEAGCRDPDLLGHGRGPGPHARGCWLVDAVLGRG